MNASVGLAYATRQFLKMRAPAMLRDRVNNPLRYSEGIATLFERDFWPYVMAYRREKAHEFGAQWLLLFDLGLEWGDAGKGTVCDAGRIERIRIVARSRVGIDG